MAIFDGLYATDEDIAVRAQADYHMLIVAPVLAAGRDGTLAEAAPWVLSSATNDFEAQGVEPGHVVLLDKMDATKPYNRPQSVFGIASVSGNDLTMRPLGEEVAPGLGPGAYGDATSVEFRVATARPQIQMATTDIRRRLRIASDADLREIEDVNSATIEFVLCRVYMTQARQVRAGDASEWVAKGRSHCNAYKDLIESLSIIYKVALGPSAPIAGEMRAGTDTGAYPFEPWEPGHRAQRRRWMAGDGLYED